MFRLVSLGATEPFFYDIDRKTTRTVRPAVSAYSSPQPIPATGKIVFYRLGEQTAPSVPPPRVPVAEISVPTEEPKPLIIILIPGGLPGRPLPTLSNGQAAQYSAVVLDDSPDVAPRDHLRVVSFSKRQAGVMLGNTSVQLAPFESKLIAYPHGDRAAFKVATFSHEQWIPIVGHTQMLSPGTRLTLFISDLADLPGQPSVSSELILRKIVEVP